MRDGDVAIMPEHYGVHRAPTVELIQQLAAVEAIQVTEHAANVLFKRRILIDSVRASVGNKTTIREDYPDDPRGHCCLVECENKRGDLFHCVCAIVEDNVPGGLSLLIITVFEPE